MSRPTPSNREVGQNFEGADRFKPRHFREYLVSFEDVPIWSIGSFVKMIHEHADGMLIGEVQVSVGITLTTCTLSEFDDPELRRFEDALAEQFVEATTSLSQQRQAASLAEIEAGY